MAGRRDKPNVVVFFTDQQRWDSAGLHGNPLELMPNFDRLAMRGTFVPYSFTCQPVCGPARACLQSGKYATEVNVHTNGIALEPEHRTLADYFNEAGYHTGYVGKWHLGGQGGAGPVEEKYRGRYQYWLASNVLEMTSTPYHTVMYDGKGQPVELPGYRVDAVTDAAIRYIYEKREEPFFLFTSFLEPHFQNHLDDFPPPDGYREKYTGRWTPPDLAALGGSTYRHIAGYWGMVKRLDEALGRITDALKSMGLLDNTILLFTSDHACHFKTRNSEYKRSCHESSIHVPTFFHGSIFNGGGRISELVSIPDLTATLLDAAGMEIPSDYSGRSIIELLRGGAADWPEEVFVQISEAQCGRAVRTKRWKYGVDAPDKDGNAVGSGRYVEQYLYDLEADPYELNNLAGSEAHRKVADRMRDRLLARMKAVGEPDAEIVPAEPRKMRYRVSEEEVEM